jgi:Zn-dependent protease with chaperone function
VLHENYQVVALPMTNFFAHQEAARRRTMWMLVYFAVSIIVLIVLTYLLVAAIFVYGNTDENHPVPWWQPQLFFAVAILMLLLVAGCMLYKIYELGAGGKGVALMMGGSELVGNTTNLRERRLLNVVEEMAIASGVPVPAVYVMPDEPGINAFAAGYAPGSAVVTVSRGCLDYLTREELQGVVAHEFSHILNGDMRLNIRLIGIVAGIFGLALIGSVLMRVTYYSSGSSSSSRSSKGTTQIFLLGLGLYIFGLLGAFLGNLLKAAISRQREFLADASAVQFTRNPDGIGGALKKIGGLTEGPNIKSPNAPDASHMFFADALLSKRFIGLLATHPPLEERIRRVDPNWNGAFPEVSKVSADTDEKVAAKAARVPPLIRGMPAVPGMPQVPLPVLALDSEDYHKRVGKVTPEQSAYAANLHAEIPEVLRDAAREPFSARALIYCLLLDATVEVRDAQLAALKNEVEPRDYDDTLRLASQLPNLSDAARLPLVDLAVPALRQMSRSQYDHFRESIEHLIWADHRLSVFEYVLRCVLLRYLDPNFGRPTVRANTPSGLLTGFVVTVLSELAWEGQDDEASARKSFEAGMRHYMYGANTETMLVRAECTLEKFDRALQSLAGASPGAKKRILLACSACIAADGEVTVREAELYRAIGDTFGVPIPPLPTGQSA